MEMKSMELPKSEMKETAIAQPENSGPRYPWGLNLRLENAVIDKLGMTELPAVGDVVMIVAKAKIESVSVNENSEKEKNKSVGVQITEMAIEPEKKIDIEKSMYGKK